MGLDSHWSIAKVTNLALCVSTHILLPEVPLLVTSRCAAGRLLLAAYHVTTETTKL